MLGNSWKPLSVNIPSQDITNMSLQIPPLCGVFSCTLHSGWKQSLCLVQPQRVWCNWYVALLEMGVLKDPQGLLQAPQFEKPWSKEHVDDGDVLSAGSLEHHRPAQRLFWLHSSCYLFKVFPHMLTLHIFCQLTSWPGIFPTTTSFLPPHTDGQLSVKAGGSGAGLAAALVPSE